MAATPEGAVKNGVRKLLHDKGFIRAGSAKKHWPDEVQGWYYMPVSNGMGVSGIPDFVCCWKGRFLTIETKAPGKLANVSANQVNRINEIRLSRGLAVVIDDPAQLEEIFSENK